MAATQIVSTATVSRTALVAVDPVVAGLGKDLLLCK